MCHQAEAAAEQVAGKLRKNLLLKPIYPFSITAVTWHMIINYEVGLLNVIPANHRES